MAYFPVDRETNRIPYMSLEWPMAWTSAESSYQNRRTGTKNRNKPPFGPMVKPSEKSVSLAPGHPKLATNGQRRSPPMKLGSLNPTLVQITAADPVLYV